MPADSSLDQGSGVHPLTNDELARIFHEIGDILEVKGELVFKTVAYHRAADAIERAAFDVAEAYGAGDRRPVPGVGRAISDKIVELATTGRMAVYERLRTEIPRSLVDLLRIPGVGPRTVRLVHEELGVQTLDDLRRAAEEGRLRGLRGISSGAEAKILDGIAQLEARPRRMLLDQAQELSDRLVARLADTPGVRRIVQAGSLRRRRETIGDLDLLVETDLPEVVVDRFVHLDGVDHVLGAGRAKASIRLSDGPQVDLMIMPPGEAGTYLVHFTGSAAHNVRLRGIARERGWSLSEKGFARLGDDGQPSTGGAADLRTFPDEAAAYAFLDLPYIEPELREDRGEVEAARDGVLPTLVTRADLRGDLHTHSDWSDGIHAIAAMADAGRRLGHGYQVLTDHSQSLAIAHGLDRERVELQRTIIAALNARYAAEEATGTFPAGAGAGRLPAPPRLRAGGPRGRAPGLRRRPARGFRRRGGIRSRRPAAVAGRADPSHAQRDQEPPRGRDRAPRRPDDPVTRRPGPGLGCRVRGRRGNRDGAGDQRLAAPAGPVRRAGASGRRDRLPARDRLRCPPDRGAAVPAVGRGPGPSGVGEPARRGQHAGPDGAPRVGCREAVEGLRALPSPTMNLPDESRVLARRELVLVATVLVGMARVVDLADAFLLAALLPIVVLFAGSAVLAREDGLARPFESLLIPAVLTGGAGAAIHLVPAGLGLVPALAAFALAIDRVVLLEMRLLGQPTGASEADRSRVLLAAVVTAFIAFTGIAVLVPGALVEPAGASAAADSAQRAISEGWLAVLALDDALVALVLGYRVAAFRFGTARDAARSALTYGIVIGIAARRRARDRPATARRSGGAHARVLPVGCAARVGTGSSP